MGRPQKAGLSYFPLDVDIFNDIKIRRLIRVLGAKAVTVIMCLLCYIYREGYFVELNVDIPFVVSETTGVDESFVTEVIERSVQIGFFSPEQYRSNGVLTSSGIQKRYLSACAASRRKNISIDKYSCLDYSEETGVYSEETGVYSEETGVYSEESLVNTEGSAQNKEKEIKGKKIKGNNIMSRDSEIIDTKEKVEIVIGYLNSRLGTRYRTTSKAATKLITALLNKEFTVEDCKAVVDKKFDDWRGTEYAKYLRPETLFGTKFEGYLNQIATKKPAGNDFKVIALREMEGRNG